MVSRTSIHPPESGICKCCGKKLKKKVMKATFISSPNSLEPPHSSGVCPCCHQKL